MSDKNDGGDKTEQPTQKRLDDARKKGDVAKSKDVTSVVGLAIWFALAALVVGYATSRLAGLYDALFLTIGQGWSESGFAGAARAVGAQCAEAGVLLAAMVLVPAAAIGLLIEFLQVGPILTFEKISPKLDHLNPAEGVKRMFSVDNLIEVAKAIAKAALLFLVGWLIVRSALPELVMLARTPDLPASVVGVAIWSVTKQLLGWSVALFAGVALLDAVWQKHSFTKKMRMSLRDIKQEMKDSEGDPHIKGQRRQMHQEWSQRNSTQAAANANVLVVNPTHIAIAIDYDRESHPVPTIAAKGEDQLALAMRAAAEEAGVPIVRNIPLARDLLARAEVGEIIPSDLFEVIAEVILWAREVREQVEATRRDDPLDPPKPVRMPAPGEDLTRYTDEAPPSWNRSP